MPHIFNNQPVAGRFLRGFATFLVLLVGINSARAFTLLGPFAPWMTKQLAYRDDVGFTIGGPMNIGEGYRWNVPVVTYAFDPSFLEFFGSNGVAAVESAIQILNDLPPASQMDLEGFPLATRRVNHVASDQGLLDLKSHSLLLLLEQLGLTSPSRFTFCLREFSSPTNYTPLIRNFDPLNFAPTNLVNATEYFGGLIYDGNVADLAELPINPAADWFPAVADGQLSTGDFFEGLTRDDAGGLRYLLNPSNIAMESLIPCVHGVGTNASNYVTMALRPGIDKITFQRLQYDSFLAQLFTPMTNQFVDSYLSNGMLHHQTLERVITYPDILFTAPASGADTPTYARTGTSNWVNNGLPSHDGPGVIQPPVSISFDRIGPILTRAVSVDSPLFQQLYDSHWGSFDRTTNPPVVYGSSISNSGPTLFRMRLETAPTHAGFSTFSWLLTGPPNAEFLLQDSTDLVGWTNITTITNLGGTFTFREIVYYSYSSNATTQRFYRTVPQ